ncbi:ribosome small subunit-dependent GTPase A [Gordonia sp. 'Campus']|uniref:ribosome small subunit-dependent GTPase A n=1 Tax=Gordonia sp. 'Campus' TaxID=2915824 RepID=UPI001EE4069F|nr:ribosome small subunit-dependent GTPase A [Gordonia sp. 'Campus']
MRDEAFGPFRADGLVPGRVVRAERGFCDVVADGRRLRTALAPHSDDDNMTPCTGDWVAVRPPTPTVEAAVVRVLDRRTAVVRATASRNSRVQVLAANVDTVVVVASLADPITPGRIERMLALAWESGGMPVLVLTKADRCSDVPQALSDVTAVAPGVEVVVTSAVTGDGFDALAATLRGTVVLIGPSGAGKSSLGNRLLGDEILPTNAVRESDGKGRHTTTWRELVPLPRGGVLLDTPGLRGVGLADADDGIDTVFAEITELAARCRFTDCAHAGEPGCAVVAAIESGALPRRRLDSYHRLQRENEYAASRSDARLRAERERRRKQISRMQRAMYRSDGR